jgi:hypothetical protein
MMKQVMLSHAMMSPNKQRLDASGGQWICMQLLYGEGGYAYIVAFVESGNKKILLDFNPEYILCVIQRFSQSWFQGQGCKGTQQSHQAHCSSRVTSNHTVPNPRSTIRQATRVPTVDQDLPVNLTALGLR